MIGHDHEDDENKCSLKNDETAVHYIEVLYYSIRSKYTLEPFDFLQILVSSLFLVWINRQFCSCDDEIYTKQAM